jgi:hypothetical protein
MEEMTMTAKMFAARCARRFGLVAAALVLGLAAPGNGQGRGNPNPGIAPPNAKPFGKTYGEWAAAWWLWAVGIPADYNPILDETGEFCDQGQSGPVWFLAGNFGGETERTCEVPAGKALFFPILNSLWWAPDDLDDAAFVAAFLGLDPDELTDDELIRLIARFRVGPDPELTLTIDGVAARNLNRYYVESPGFRILDTDLIDDLGAEISQPNRAVTAGYYVMLAPLPAGEHTIRFTAQYDNPIFGEFALDVTYHLTVAPGKP